VAVLGVVLVVLGFLALAGLRTAGDVARVGLGLWVVLAGSLVAWLGGYLHTRRRPLSRAEALRLAR
jgi:hypothetical protein